MGNRGAHRRGLVHKGAGLGLLLVFVAAVALIYTARGGGAPSDVPAVFAQGLTYQAATERSAQSGTPVLVYATASWCGPCQAFKRGALSDPGVERLIAERTLPVYLDIDRHTETAGALGVRAVPMLIVLRGSTVVGSHTGAMTAAQTAAFVREHTAPGAVSPGD